MTDHQPEKTPDGPFIGWDQRFPPPGFPATPAQVEPNAGQREMATHFRGCYCALVNEGFTASEAITLIVAMIQKPS